MQRLPSLRLTGLLLALAVTVLLSACSAAHRTASWSAATPREWAVMTSTADGSASAGVVSASFAGERAASTASDLPAPLPVAAVDDDGGHGFVHGVLLYIPNRIFDLFDIVRLRLRIGPGFAADVRATELADAFIGFYSSIFVGIPGPRGAPFANWPIGFENRAGAELSVIDASSGGTSGPHYGKVEFGVGVHLALVGIDIGVDPWEAVDFVTGILTIDLVGDDL